jgi:hypothetical protein
MSPNHPTDDDEIVSAVLDGEATPDEVARVAADPVLSARLEVLRRVADAVATPVVPLDEAARTSLIDAAIAAATGPDAAETGGVMDELAARRSRRGGGSAVPWLAAAAVLVALVGLGALLLDRSDGEADFVAVGRAIDSADDAGPTADGEGVGDVAGDAATGAPAPTTTMAGGFGADAPEAAARTTTEPVPVLDPAGELAGPEDVRRWAVGLVDVAGAPPDEDASNQEVVGPTDEPSCPTTTLPRALATATYQGRPVELVVGDADDGTPLVEVVDPLTCEVLAVVGVPGG